jgi:hypothetical protein
VDVERLQFPGWAAPLVGGIGGAIAGIFIVSENDLPSASSLLTAFLGGAFLGVLAGSIVWIADRLRRVPPVPDLASQVWPYPIPIPSRRTALAVVAGGIAVLAVNHAMVVLADTKSLEIVLLGATFLVMGIGECVHPSFMLGARTTRRASSLFPTFIAVVFAIGGVGLALWLWAVVYS